MIERVFYHYEQWEDYKNRMYDRPETGITSEERIQKAIECLSDETICLENMRKVVREWPIGTEQVLTNRSQNRKAWLGWCACFMYGGCHDEETRKAWNIMTDEARKSANAIAEKVIKEWEAQYENAVGN